jgi:hypothetical protein
MKTKKGRAKKKVQPVASEVATEGQEFVEMRSETLPARAIPVGDREGRINYTLDMVVHDLISQGTIETA